MAFRREQNSEAAMKSFKVELIEKRPVTKTDENEEEIRKKKKNVQKVNIKIDEDNILIEERKTGVTILKHTGDKITSVHQDNRKQKCLWYVHEANNGVKEMVAIRTKKKSYPFILQALLEIQIKAAKYHNSTMMQDLDDIKKELEKSRREAKEIDDIRKEKLHLEKELEESRREIEEVSLQEFVATEELVKYQTRVQYVKRFIKKREKHGKTFILPSVTTSIEGLPQ